MPTALVMPKLGMAMEAGTVLRWLKAEGEAVTAGMAVAEIETDKAVAEVEAPCDGRLGRIQVEPGARVPVGTVLCQILAPGETEAGAGAPAPHGEAPAAGAGAPAPDGEAPAAGAGARLTPAARRVLRELGLDPGEVAAAFPGGRVTREQLAAWAAARGAEQAAATAAAVPAPAAPAVPAPDATPPAGAGGVPERRPLTVMRAAIARRMMESLRESAQLTLTAEVDVTPLVEFRAALAPAFEREYGFRPTYTDFLVKAMARAVPAVPHINARWEKDAIAILPAVHVGVAVALDDGLIVPVVRDAHALSLVGIGRRVRDLAGRARQGQLQPGEASGSTITLTNLGAEGIDAFTPVLNPPEVAILGAGRVREVPALVDGQWRPRSVMTLSLTIDHRVVDGAPGARYLRRVAELLAQPALLVAG